MAGGFTEGAITGGWDGYRANGVDGIWSGALKGGTIGGISNGISASLFGSSCFAASTPLLTPDGSKLIEQIKEGDYVLARDEFDVDAPVVPKRVEEVFVRTAIVLDLKVGGKVIKTTVEHPFYVKEKGWTPVCELEAGDLLATDNGRWLEVEALVETGEITTVYNFRVADYHTFADVVGKCLGCSWP